MTKIIATEEVDFLSIILPYNLYNYKKRNI